MYRHSMAIDTTTIKYVNGLIGVYGLKAITTVARAVWPLEGRPYPTPGYEYVPANPREKDIELS